MKSSYIDYSMSVIVARALPDVRDGLKPVHRRILYAMAELGLWHNRPHRKSARVVGEVLGKYHPHGDLAVYEAMVRMAQDFSMRYPLIDGQGNFGSIDGDSAAAMRYTEVRLTRIAEELLRDLKKDTVDFVPNFDGSLKEPVVLPAALPNLLMNGASGIAVGMATNIPPHNLGELIDGIVAYIDNPEITIAELMEHIPAPDFPTGGIIYGYSGVREAYHTGRGRVIMRARIHEEVLRGKRRALIVTELPFQVNKSTLLEKIARLVREKRIEGISDLRDESDRSGMRIVIELKHDAAPLVVQNQLFKYTQLQQTFGVNMVALVNGRPRTLNLKEAIRHYVEHRHEVLMRRTRFELKHAEARAHILEGLKIALDHLDEVIAIIRNSEDTQEALTNLMEGTFPARLTREARIRLELPAEGKADFTLSEKQAKAILDMRLQRLTGLEQRKVEEELASVRAEITRLCNILDKPELRMQIIKEELLDNKARYADARRTEIDFQGGDDFDIEDLIEDETVVVTITHQGLIKRTPLNTYRQQGRGGKGVRGSGTRDEDFVEHLYTCSTHDYLLFLTDAGRAYTLRVYQIPEGTRTARGRSLRNLIEIGQHERVRAVVSIKKEQFEDPDFMQQHYVIMATRKGKVKKTQLYAFRNARQKGIIAIEILDNDDLLDAGLTNGQREVVLATSDGYAIRFKESDVRPMGRTSQGVKGITLRPGAQVVGMVIVDTPDKDILVISEKGYGKRSPLEDYRLQTRGGKGIITMKVTPKTGVLVAIKGVLDTDDLMIITRAGLMIRIRVSDIRITGRYAQGVRLINLNPGDSIADVARIVTEEEAEAVPTEASR